MQGCFRDGECACSSLRFPRRGGTVHRHSHCTRRHTFRGRRHKPCISSRLVYALGLSAGPQTVRLRRCVWPLAALAAAACCRGKPYAHAASARSTPASWLAAAVFATLCAHRSTLACPARLCTSLALLCPRRFSRYMAAQALNNLAKAAVGIGAGASLFQASVYNVDGGSRAVMFNRLSGVQKAVMGEGTHFRLPWFQTPHIFDVRIRPRNISSNTGTKDLQVVTINLVSERIQESCAVVTRSACPRPASRPRPPPLLGGAWAVNSPQ
jgi:hypothetical protein